MALPETKKGELHVFAGSIIWAVFPVTVVLSYAMLPSLMSLAASTALAVLFFAGVITTRRKWKELADFRLWKLSLAATLFIGVAFYGLYFLGLETTSPGNAAIIVLFEVFTSFVFFRLFKEERLSPNYLLGAILMVIGAVIVLGRNFTGVHPGDFIILAATLFTPIGNFYQQEARQIASAESLMFLRSLFSAPLLFAIAFILGQRTSVEAVFSVGLFLIINGVLMLGLSKLFWIEAIHRISVTKATALSSISPFFTLLIAWAILAQAPTLWQIGSLIPFTVGVLLLTDQLSFRRLSANP